MFEWIIYALCITPAAVADFKYREMDLESCIVSVLVGACIFVFWAFETSIVDVIVSGIVICVISGMFWVITKLVGGGEGDWWFVAGVSMAGVSISAMSGLYVVVGVTISISILHIIVCTYRGGIPFPGRLLSFKKRKGDKFCIPNNPDCLEKGEVFAPEESSGMAVKPAFPMVTFILVGFIIIGLI